MFLQLLGRLVIVFDERGILYFYPPKNDLIERHSSTSQQKHIEKPETAKVTLLRSLFLNRHKDKDVGAIVLTIGNVQKTTKRFSDHKHHSASFVEPF